MAASSMTGPFCCGAACGLLLRWKKWYTLSWGAVRCLLPVTRHHIESHLHEIGNRAGPTHTFTEGKLKARATNG